MIDLTKEEAAALLCKSYGLYIEERWKCADGCPNFIKKRNRCFDFESNWSRLKSGQVKLKAYIQSDISDAEEDTLP